MFARFAPSLLLLLPLPLCVSPAFASINQYSTRALSSCREHDLTTRELPAKLASVVEATVAWFVEDLNEEPLLLAALAADHAEGVIRCVEAWVGGCARAARPGSDVAHAEGCGRPAWGTARQARRDQALVALPCLPLLDAGPWCTSTACGPAWSPPSQ